MLSAFPQSAKVLKNSEQVKITERIPLLDKNGKLTKAGYCFTNMFDYDRKAIKANGLRIKEWDFYQITDGRYVMQITAADISMGGMANAILFDTKTGKKFFSNSDFKLLSLGKMGLSNDAMTPNVYERHKKNFDLKIENTETKRTIHFSGKCKKEPFTVDILMDLFENHESLIMAVPFERGDDRQFYLNQKVNCMPVTGTAKVGDLTVEFKPETSFAILDWGRGVWPFHCVWYWGNGSTRLPNGDIFGFEIGWGFGDMSAASENTLFYNGKAHKIGDLYCENDEKDWMKEWKITSSDGRFEMTMKPVFDNITKARFLCIGNVCHQVFGLWSGKAILDDGTVVEIKDVFAFCEKSDNMW